MEIKVKQRIKQIYSDEKKISERAFSEILGVGQKTFNKQMKDDTSMPLSTILLICEKIPNLSMEWLLRGVGEMYLPSNDDDTHSTPTAHLRDTSEREDMLLERIDMLKQKVQDKEELISSLKENIANLNNHIADLRHTMHYEEHSK